MPENKDKYVYIATRVALLKGSWALEKFDQDAKHHHMVDQPGKLVALRLTEYYELLERLSLQPQSPSGNGNGHTAAPTTPAAAESGTTRNRRRVQEDEDEPGSTPQAEPEQDPDAALDESISYWDNL